MHRAFWSMRRFLEYSMSGAPRITWVAIDAWERHEGYQLDPHELHAIAAMDAAYRAPDVKAG